uniref:flavin-containing monooxygenase n=1 Tax=Rhodococcus qingshengii TaxID=334542 RepID=UPI001C4DF0E4|nr:NAD(P)/FAD-dependent oxidoreductase [Rhodococcus qingshengii]
MTGIVTQEQETPTTQVQAEQVALAWLAQFEYETGAGDVDAVLALFGADCWWRDILTLTWDLRTMHGADAIKSTAADRLESTGFKDFTLNKSNPTILADGTLTAAFNFTTKLASGRGIVRLRQEDGSWRAWTLLTKIEDLSGFPEQVTTLADAQKAKHNEYRNDRETWYEYRERQREFKDREPDVVVVGAGHAGLNATARLQHMGLSTLLTEKTQRVGDVWRQRYHNLSLHDTKWYGQMPYLPYPDNWPLFAPKEMIADWFEAYAWILQLNVWTGTEVISAAYDEASERWKVHVNRDGTIRVLHPKYLVFATGAYAGSPTLPELPGIDSFQGTAVHSNDHEGGSTLRGKRVVVVGAGASGHDVAQDAYEMGAAEVTMVQRGPTYVMSSQNGVTALHGDLYSETSPPNDDADLISLSYPWPLFLQLSPPTVQEIAKQDVELLSGLEKAGFQVWFGPKDDGLFGLALRGGGYYIDKGCSQLIIDGKIKIQRGEVASFTENGVVYSDGTEASADIVVFATGWPNMRDAVRPIVGDVLGDQLTEVWGLDDEGEVKGAFRPSGHPKLWFMAGSFQMSRYGSKLLALQVKATDLGLVDS